MVDFSVERLGKSISDLRRSLGLTQNELAENICTQAQISTIEKGEVMPSAEMIFQIASQLGVDVNYFFTIAGSPRVDFVEETISEIRKSIYKRNYEEVINLINGVKSHPLFQSKIHQQFFLWHQGICKFYLDKNSEHALELLNQALHLTVKNKDKLTEREIEILNSIGIIHVEQHAYEQAILYYTQALDHIKFLPYLKDKQIKARITYNLAKALTKVGSYKKSIEICDQGINSNIENLSLYTLGELHYQKGVSLFKLGKQHEGIEYMNKAIFLFKIQKNDLFVEYIQDEIRQLQNGK